MRCSQCGTVGLEPGFTSDTGQGSRGFARWIAGPLEFGLMGGAKLMGRHSVAIHAFRCPNCSHLELFAPESVWSAKPPTSH